MKKNNLTIIINKPVIEVFEFTINPNNTPQWIKGIKEELSDNYPPNINTIYKNCDNSNRWNYYKVIEFIKNKIFTLRAFDNNYFVRYSYKKLGNNKTELEYLEWVEKGDLENPFTQDILEKLKEVLEAK
ncbi:MAG: hypothetical protein WC438_04015 [Candidatus Pacearchaeota archaeon]